MHLSSTGRWWPAVVVAVLTISVIITRVSAFASTGSSPSDRRSAMDVIASSIAAAAAGSAALAPWCLVSNNRPAFAATAPFAPIDALVPATRVRVTIDRAVDVASRLVVAAAKEDGADDDDERRVLVLLLLRDLEGLLLVHQNFNRGTTPIDVPRRPARQYLDAYREYRDGLSILDRPGAMLVQNGEIDAWRRLKRQEKAMEDADEVRAALNYYTSNLNFNPESFVLTGTREERSRMIREDKIPDVKAVIASDMGLRYLYRNDLLTAIDDARAELRHQMRLSPGAVDGGELLEVLLAVQGACAKWFGLIDERDALAAMDIVLGEK